MCDRWLVSANLSETDIEDALDACGAIDLEITRFDAPAMAEEGFDHVFTAVAAASAR